MAQSPIRFVAPSPGPATDLASTPPPPSLFRRESPTTAAMRAEREALERSLSASRPAVKPVPVRPGVTAKAPAALERGPLDMLTDFAGDSARSLLGRGTIGTGEGAVGLANIATALSPANIGARAASALLGEKAPDLTLTPLLDSVGYQPQVVRDYIAESDSDALKRARAEVEKAQGFIPTVEASLRNPSTIIQSAIESAPSMFAGQGIARGALKMAPGMAPILASAIGEGALTAGQNAEQTRQESGTLTPGQAGAAVAAGGVTAGISRLSGRLADEMGWADPDTLILGGRAASKKPRDIAARMIGGAISEGLLEEAPQSAQEQAFQNLAQGRPLGQGVMESAAQGMLTGGLMGAGSNVMPQRQAQTTDNPLDSEGLANATAGLPEYDPEDDLMSSMVNPTIGVAAGKGAVDPLVAKVVLEAEAAGEDGVATLINSGMDEPTAKRTIEQIRKQQGPKAQTTKATRAENAAEKIDAKVDAKESARLQAEKAKATAAPVAPAAAKPPTKKEIAAQAKKERLFNQFEADAVNEVQRQEFDREAQDIARDFQFDQDAEAIARDTRAQQDQAFDRDAKGIALDQFEKDLDFEREALDIDQGLQAEQRRLAQFMTPFDAAQPETAQPEAARVDTPDPWTRAERFGVNEAAPADVTAVPSPFGTLAQDKEQATEAVLAEYYADFLKKNGREALITELQKELGTNAAISDAKDIAEGKTPKRLRKKRAEKASSVEQSVESSWSGPGQPNGNEQALPVAKRDVAVSGAAENRPAVEAEARVLTPQGVGLGEDVRGSDARPLDGVNQGAVPSGESQDGAAGTPTRPRAASSSQGDASEPSRGIPARGTVAAESSPASGTTERKTEPSPSSAPPPTSGESSDAVASPRRDDAGSTAAQESEQVDDTAAGNTDSSADGSTTDPILAARNGDAGAQERLKKLGLGWDGNKTKYRMIGASEAQSLLSGEPITSTRSSHVGTGVTDITDNPDYAKVGGEFRVTFKQSEKFDSDSQNSQTREKNKAQGEYHLDGGYSKADVQRVDRRNTDGTWTSVYESDALDQVVTARGRDFSVDATEQGIFLRGSKTAKYRLVAAEAPGLLKVENEHRGERGAVPGERNALSGVRFAIKDGRLVKVSETKLGQKAPKVPGSRNPIADLWNSRKGAEEDGPEANLYRSDQPNPDDYDAEGNELPRGGPPSGPQNPSGDAGGGGVERQPAVSPSDKGALLEGPLAADGAERTGPISEPDRGSVEQDRPAVGRDALVADDAPKVSQGSAPQSVRGTGGLVSVDDPQKDQRTEKRDEGGQSTESLPPKAQIELSKKGKELRKENDVGWQRLATMAIGDRLHVAEENGDVSVYQKGYRTLNYVQEDGELGVSIMLTTAQAASLANRGVLEKRGLPEPKSATRARLAEEAEKQSPLEKRLRAEVEAIQKDLQSEISGNILADLRAREAEILTELYAEQKKASVPKADRKPNDYVSRATNRQEYEAAVVDAARDLAEGTVIQDDATGVEWTVKKHTSKSGTQVTTFDGGKNTFLVENRPDGTSKVIGSPEVAFGKDAVFAAPKAGPTIKESLKVEPKADPTRAKSEPKAEPKATLGGPRVESTKPEPQAGAIESGEVLRSESGRVMSPVPKVSTTSDRATGNTLRRLDAWLVDEAKAETTATRNEFVAGIVASMNPKNLSPSDRDTLNDILFGDEKGPKDRHRIAAQKPAKLGQSAPAKPKPEPKGMDGLTKTQRAEKKAAPKPTLDGLTKDQISAAEFDAQQLKRELAPLINSAVEENQTIHDALSPFYYNDLFGYNDSVAWADLPEATRKLAQRGGPPSRKLSMAERGKKAQGHKPGWVPPSYKQLRGLDLQVEDLVSLGWLPRGSTPSDLVDILLSDRPFYHPDGGSIDAKSQTTIAEENTIRTAQAVADETGIQPKAQLEALIRDKKNAKEVRILKALAKLDPNATQAQMDEARAKAEFEDAQEPDTVVEDTEPAPWDETQAEEPSFLKPQSAPKSKPAQKAMNVEKTAAGDQMLLPGGVAFGSNMERKKTEGREALGPLFQQEEEAAKKADAARQKSIGEDDAPVSTGVPEIKPESFEVMPDGSGAPAVFSFGGLRFSFDYLGEIKSNALRAGNAFGNAARSMRESAIEKMKASYRTLIDGLPESWKNANHEMYPEGSDSKGSPAPEAPKLTGLAARIAEANQGRPLKGGDKNGDRRIKDAAKRADAKEEASKETDKGVALFERKPAAATMTKAQWQHYNNLGDAGMTREAIRDGAPVVGATAGVRVVDFQHDVDKQVVSMMVQWSASLASKVGGAVRMLQRHVPNLVFGGFSPAGNLHGVHVYGEVFINYLATHQLALEVAKKEGITYEEAFARELFNVLIHESAHNKEKGHGPEFEAEVARIIADLGPQGKESMLRDFRSYAANEQNRTRTQRMYEKAAPGWIEGERRGREAAANAGAAGARGADAQQSERLRPRPRSDTGGDQDSLGDDEPAGGVRMARRAEAGDMAESPGLRRPDGRGVDPSFSRKPSASTPALVAQQEAEDLLANVEETFLERMEAKTRDQLNRFGRIQPIVEKSSGIKAKVDFQQHIQGITARAEPKLEMVKSVLVDKDAGILARNRLDFALAGDYATAMDPKSKMSPEKRADALKRVKASGKEAAYEQFRERTKHLQMVADSMRLKAGLDSQKGILARRERRGEEWVESADRQGKPAHPYLQALRAVERAVLQVERNDTMRALADFVEQAGLSSFGTVRKGAPGPEGVGFKIAGQQFSIDLKDSRLAQQIQQISAKNVDTLTNTLGAMTRFKSRIETSLSPEFIPRNAFRDWMGAVFLGFIQSGVPNGITKSVAYKVAKGQIRAAKGVFNYLKNPAASFEQGSPAWWVKQAFKNGAVPGYFSQVRSLAQQESELREALKDHLTGTQVAQMSADEAKAVLSDNSLSPQRKAFKYVTIKASEASRRLGFRKALDTILWANKIGEAATRANYYQAQVEEGQSPARAGDLTRNLFDPSKKAEWKAGMNAVWAFSHAAIEGAAHVAELAAPDTRFYPSRQTPEVRRRAQGAMAALVAAGAAWATMLAMQMGDDDDDGVPDADQIPLYVGEKGLIFPGTKGVPLVLPFAQGFNVPFFIGQLLSKVTRGTITEDKALREAAKSVINAFDPITTNYKMPTAISPLVDIAANEDVFGRKIGPTKFPGDPRPDSQMAMGSTSSAAKAIAQGLNRVTGGSDIRSGAIDIAPDSIEHIADFFAGGLGRFAQRVITAGKEINEGKIPTKIPGFSGWSHPISADYRNRYYTQAQEIDAIKASVNQKEKSILQDEAKEQFPNARVESLTLPELREALQASGVSAARREEFQKAFDDRDRKLLSVRSKFQEAEKMLKAMKTQPDSPEKEEKQREIWLAVNRAYNDALKGNK